MVKTTKKKSAKKRISKKAARAGVSKKHKISAAEKISRLKLLIWLGWIPKIIGLVFGILWLLFGVLEGISTPQQWYLGLIEGAIIGGVILATTWVLFKLEHIGAGIFAAESLFVIGLLIFRRISYVATYLALAIPLLIIAILAFAHYFYAKGMIENRS